MCCVQFVSSLSLVFVWCLFWLSGICHMLINQISKVVNFQKCVPSLRVVGCRVCSVLVYFPLQKAHESTHGLVLQW